MTMTITSVNVSLPRSVQHAGETISTSIFKQPVTGPVALLHDHLDNDGQADRVHHGGADKAVYAYALDHYAYWEEVLERSHLPPGSFGENLTVRGLDEATCCLGDQLRIGNALLVITQPRVPCFKLGIALNEPTLPRRFARSLRVGFYLRVLRPGTIQAGDEVSIETKSSHRLSIQALFAAYLDPRTREAQALLGQALQVPELAEAWRPSLRKRMAKPT